jgi:hypothetical protein
MKKKRPFILLIILFGLLSIFSVSIILFYQIDKRKNEPKLWIGFFDYRLNFRDVGQSLNTCLGDDAFHTKKIYRSNKYFSGWSCNKIHNVDKIYSFNYSPWDPKRYYCLKPDGSRQYGIQKNSDFELTQIEDLAKWQNPQFQKAMCSYFEDAINDLIYYRSFLFHCDVGRDRTGAFAAMLVMSLAENKDLRLDKIRDAIECDYQKTSALEPFKRGSMKSFLEKTQNEIPIWKFIEKKCSIPQEKFALAAQYFIK